ncbi:MAG: OmpH family outer membrane protein [Nitrospinota bacterium]
MKKVILKTASVFVFGSFLFIFSLQIGYAAPPPLAIVDLQAALNTSEPGKKAMAELKSRMDNEYANIKKKEQDLKAIEDLINRQGLLMKESEKRQKEEEYLGKRKSLERAKEDLRENLTRIERQITQKIIKELVTVTRKVGQEEGYSIIIEKGQGVIYSIDNVNITDKVIQRYNDTKK